MLHRVFVTSPSLRGVIIKLEDAIDRHRDVCAAVPPFFVMRLFEMNVRAIRPSASGTVEVDLCRHLSMKTIRQIASPDFSIEILPSVIFVRCRSARHLPVACRLAVACIGNVRLRKHLRQHAFDQGQAGP